MPQAPASKARLGKERLFDFVPEDWLFYIRTIKFFGDRITITIEKQSTWSELECCPQPRPLGCRQYFWLLLFVALLFVYSLCLVYYVYYSPYESRSVVRHPDHLVAGRVFCLFLFCCFVVCVYVCSLCFVYFSPNEGWSVVRHPDHWKAGRELLQPLQTLKWCPLVQQTWQRLHIWIQTVFLRFTSRPDKSCKMVLLRFTNHVAGQWGRLQDQL